ncbi:MAG TPA: TlpA disulfide reductase family protein [Ignavibacteria bacterium]|nr:TlpA disulfide reductase family protein [Ignavibacteria bacterium]
MRKYFLILFITLIVSNYSFAQNYTDFTLSDLEGNEVKISELLKSGPVWLGFWATWCTPCKEEMKYMNQLWNKYKDKGFTYVAVNNDDQKSLSKVKSYIGANGYEFPVVLDADQKVFESYQGNGHPFSVFISQDGKIVAQHLGYVSGDEKKFEEEIIGQLK